MADSFVSERNLPFVLPFSYTYREGEEERVRNQGRNLDYNFSCHSRHRPSHRQRNITSLTPLLSRQSPGKAYTSRSKGPTAIPPRTTISGFQLPIVSLYVITDVNPFYALKILLPFSPPPIHLYQPQKHPASHLSDGFCSPDSPRVRERRYNRWCELT